MVVVELLVELLVVVELLDVVVVVVLVVVVGQISFAVKRALSFWK